RVEGIGVDARDPEARLRRVAFKDDLLVPGQRTLVHEQVAPRLGHLAVLQLRIHTRRLGHLRLQPTIATSALTSRAVSSRPSPGARSPSWTGPTATRARRRTRWPAARKSRRISRFTPSDSVTR